MMHPGRALTLCSAVPNPLAPIAQLDLHLSSVAVRACMLQAPILNRQFRRYLPTMDPADHTMAYGVAATWENRLVVCTEDHGTGSRDNSSL